MNSLGTGIIEEIISALGRDESAGRSATEGGSMMRLWAFALLSGVSLVIVLTGCVQQPLASYRDPQTGRLCWARLDADEVRCTMPSRTP